MTLHQSRYRAFLAAHQVPLCSNYYPGFFHHPLVLPVLELHKMKSCSMNVFVSSSFYLTSVGFIPVVVCVLACSLLLGTLLSPFSRVCPFLLVGLLSSGTYLTSRLNYRLCTCEGDKITKNNATCGRPTPRRPCVRAPLL